jgi:Predicted Rossmann fold nucleotide-binding protein involved in DNA uptake
MNNPLSANTQAILLLTAPLIIGKREGGAELLSLSDYNRLARALREAKRQPSDLLQNGPESEEARAVAAERFGRGRIEKLLARGFLLGQAMERWASRAIWVFSRADASYPRRLKAKLKEEAPPVIYGCGDVSLLESGGLAVVGSRHVDDALLSYTENIGALAARAGVGVISGGAKGIDRAAMGGGLKAGGIVIGVLADSLERAAISRENREAIMEKRLVLISSCDPAAGFNVGHAMQRNKFIYALADAALVVSSDLEKGGTWAGAIEQLEKFHFGPLYVRNGADAPAGNLELLRRGGLRWPDPQDAQTLVDALKSGGNQAQETTVQDALPLSLNEDAGGPYGASVPNVGRSNAAETPLSSVSPEEAASNEIKPAAQLLACVKDLLLNNLSDGLTEAEVSELLAVNKSQVKAWIKQLCDAGCLIKVKKSKPALYRATERSDTLF